MSKHTPLHDMHLAKKALMVDFAGWNMPLHYGSQIEEHHQVRRLVGMFDVSHMGIVDVEGEETKAFLRYLLANNIDKLTEPGTALYTCMLNPSGGVMDDLIVYYRSPTHYRLVINAATTEEDLAWMQGVARDFKVVLTLQTQLAMIAVQGPLAFEKVKAVLDPTLHTALAALKPFHFLVNQGKWIARTGYTGETGLEIILPSKEAVPFWQSLLAKAVPPIGLGARDTLRLEAGLNLYGQDMDKTVTPLESNLAWTVAFLPENRHFIGRASLEAQKKRGMTQKLVGILLLEKGVLRPHQSVYVGNEKVGSITSGTFSPTLKTAIALARVDVKVGKDCEVEIRDKRLKAQVVKPPFLKKES